MLTRPLWNWRAPFILNDGLGAGFWGCLPRSQPHVPAPPCPALLSWPCTDSSVFDTYESSWIIFMVAGLKWVSAGSNVVEQGRETSGNLAGSSWLRLPWSHRLTLVTLPRSHKLLSAGNWNLSVLYRVLTTGLSNAVTGRKWLWIYSTWFYCLFANTDVWCFIVYAKIQTYWTGHNCRFSGVSCVHSTRNS